MKYFGNFFYLLRTDFFINHHYGIVDVSTFDKVVGYEPLQFMEEAKGAAGRYVGIEILQVLKGSVLGA